MILLPLEKEYSAPRCAYNANPSDWHAGCSDDAAPSLFFCYAHQRLVDGDEARREVGYGENDCA